jgi:hypothetical protein
VAGQPKHSTKGSYTSIINKRLSPQWGTFLISDIRPADLHAWFQSLALALVTKGHLRSLMHKLFPGLMHLRVALAGLVLGGGRRMDNGRIHDRARRNADAPGLQMPRSCFPC